MTPDNGVVEDYSQIYEFAHTRVATLTAFRTPLIEPNRFQPDPLILKNPSSDQNAYGWWNPEKALLPPSYGTFQEISDNGNTWSGPDDHSSSFAVTHDTSRVYVTIIVKDDDFTGCPGGQVWAADGVQIGLSTADNIGLKEDGLPKKQSLINFCMTGYGSNETEKVTQFEKNVPDDAKQDFGWSFHDMGNHMHRYVFHFGPSMFDMTGSKFPADFQFGLAIAVWDDGQGWSGLNYRSLLYCPGWGGIDSKCPQYNALVSLSPRSPPSYMHAESCKSKPCSSSMTYRQIPPMKVWDRSDIGNPTAIPKWGLRQHLSGGWHSKQEEKFYNSDVNAAYYVNYDSEVMHFSIMTRDLEHYGSPSIWAGDGVQLAWNTQLESALTDCTSEISAPDVLMNVAIVPSSNGTLEMRWSMEKSSGLNLISFQDKASFSRSEDNVTYYHFEFSPSDFGKTVFSPGDIIPFGWIVNDNAEGGDPVLSWHNQNAWAGMGHYSIIGGKKACALSMLSLEPHGEDVEKLFSPPDYPIKVSYIKTYESLMKEDRHKNNSWLNFTFVHPNNGTFQTGSMSVFIDFDQNVTTSSHLTGINADQCGVFTGGRRDEEIESCWKGHTDLLWYYYPDKGLDAELKASNTGLLCEAMFKGLTEEEKQNVDPNNHGVCFSEPSKIDLEIPVANLKSFHFALKVTHKPKTVRITRYADEAQIEASFTRPFPWDYEIA
jgi:hypothetical protein